MMFSRARSRFCKNEKLVTAEREGNKEVALFFHRELLFLSLKLNHEEREREREREKRLWSDAIEMRIVRCLCEWHLSLPLRDFLIASYLGCLYIHFFPQNKNAPSAKNIKKKDHVRVNRRGVDEQRERVRSLDFTTFLPTTALAKERSSRRRTQESTTKIRVFEEDFLGGVRGVGGGGPPTTTRRATTPGGEVAATERNKITRTSRGSHRSTAFPATRQTRTTAISR
jgi:hypothetical protein